MNGYRQSASNKISKNPAHIFYALPFSADTRVKGVPGDPGYHLTQGKDLENQRVTIVRNLSDELKVKLGLHEDEAEIFAYSFFSTICKKLFLGDLIEMPNGDIFEKKFDYSHKKMSRNI